MSTKDQAWADRKSCSKCKKVKPASGFGRRSASKDGLRSQCKECEREAGRKYAKSEHGRAVRAAYRSTEKGKEIFRAARAKYSSTYHGKMMNRTRQEALRKTPRGRARQLASWAVQAEVKAGRMPPARIEPCSERSEDCEGRHEYHHDSYLEADRLSVRCLCAFHHKEWHAKHEAVYPAVRAMKGGE